VFLAVLTFLAMVSGELFGLAQTGDRIVAERERRQAPARAQIEAHNRATVRVEAAQTVLDELPKTSQRLEKALANKANADAAVIEKSAERGCATNCRALLEQQVDLAQREIEATRAELRSERERAARELAQARAALKAAPLPAASETPLADRLGIDPAKLDMVIAALGAFGANGLAACLIAFGAHGRQRVEIVKAQANPASTPKPPAAPAKSTRAVAVLPNPQRDPRQHAAEFSVRCLKPAPDEALPLSCMDARYKAWCAENSYPRLSPTDLAREVWQLFGECGIPIESVDGELVARGVALAD
jgi:hypothetical protein